MGTRGQAMAFDNWKIIDISLELDGARFRMHVPGGFTKDMQFAVEVLKDHDAAGGAGQIVRGLHMRLHAGSHVDAPEHFVKGGRQVHDIPLETFIGPAIVADVRDRVPGHGIGVEHLEREAGDLLESGDRLLLRTDCNKTYFTDDWMRRSPYLAHDAIDWCIDKGVSIVGFDCFHGADAPDSTVKYYTSRKLCESGILLLPYLDNLDRITQRRVTLVALPLKMVGVEASPVRAIAIEG